MLYHVWLRRFDNSGATPWQIVFSSNVPERAAAYAYVRKLLRAGVSTLVLEDKETPAIMRAQSHD